MRFLHSITDPFLLPPPLLLEGRPTKECEPPQARQRTRVGGGGWAPREGNAYDGETCRCEPGESYTKVYMIIRTGILHA